MHYICTGGCKGVSEVPGVCTDEECPHRGDPLFPCECTDGNHGGAFERLTEDEEEE